MENKKEVKVKEFKRERLFNDEIPMLNLDIRTKSSNINQVKDKLNIYCRKKFSLYR